MLRKNFTHHEFSRRTLLLGAGKLLLLSALGARMYYLQVVDSDQYKTQADGNRIRLYPLLPNRGKILDRNGVVLAEGTKRYQVLYEASDSASDRKLVEKISHLLEMDFNKQQELLQKIALHDSKHPILLEDFLSWEQVAAIEVNSPDLAGVSINAPEIRSYPHGSDVAHITGYLGKVSKNEFDGGPLTSHPDYRKGKTGIEKSMNETLKGVAGIRHAEVDSRGRFVRSLQEESAITGDDVHLTLDMDLQEFVVKKLSKKGGLQTEGASCVVMDIDNGEVLAMASVPAYDPNQFVRGIKQDYWDSLLNNPDSPFSNKCISLQYPPGSTFKMVSALAGLEAGVINPETTHYCSGHHTFGGRKFHCWNKYGHGEVDMTKALAVSCNVYFFKVATQIGVDNMADMARRFGLGTSTGVELPNEKSGLVPDQAWKRDYFDKPWYGGETLNNVIGQGFLLSTPMQLAMMTSRIASGGKKVIPRLTSRQNNFSYQGDYAEGDYELVGMDNDKTLILPKKKREFGNVDVNPAHVRSVMQGMSDVTNKDYGGSYKARIKDSKYAMAGKTGTAQVRSHRRYKHVPAERAARYHAIFVGYAPVHKPKYALSVVVEHGGYGSVAAAPLGRDILQKVQEINDV